MKRLTILTFSALLLVFLGAQVVPAVQGQSAALEKHPLFKTLTPQEAGKMITSRKDLLLIDIRNQDELREGYIAGSTLMPLWDIVKGTQRPPRNKPILLICAVGGRSLALGQLLSKSGWDEVYNLKGGIAAWKEAQLPLQY